MAAIGWKLTGGTETWIFKCGGSLINTKYVLTAAHCSVSFPSKEIQLEDVLPKIVRLGTSNILDAMEKPVTFADNIRPACLWSGSQDEWVGKKATVAGWGYTNANAKTGSEVLLTAQVDIVVDTECGEPAQHANECLREWCGPLHHICAGVQDSNLASIHTPSMDTCQRDSGGPLLVPGKDNCTYYVVGLTAFGAPCGTPNSFAVYTKVSSFIQWISETSKES